MKRQNGIREETFSLEQKGPAPGHGQEATRPIPALSAFHRRRRLPHLNQATIIALLIAILVTTSVLAALLTYWVGH